MADEFVDLAVEIDSEELADQQFAYMEEAFPGWQPASANLDTWILEDGARVGGEVGSLTLVVSPEIFRVYGEKIVRLLPGVASFATAVSTWTLADIEGHVIEAGTRVEIAGVEFEVVADVEIAAGADIAPGVELVAVEEGADANELTEPVEVTENVGFAVTSVVLDAPTSGGEDEEVIDDYLDRLASEAELFAPRPLLPRDVEIFSRRVQGIDRCLVLDNFKPGPPYDADPADPAAELTFTTCPIDDQGNWSTAGARAQWAALWLATRGTNWRMFIIEPTYTIMDVNFVVVAHAGLDPADVEQRVIAAIAAFLSPGNWGNSLFGERQRWINTPEVRHRELAAVIDAVEGVDYIPTLEFGVQGAGPLTENIDVALAGDAPLPRPGDITGVVTAP